jgi:hypothetical protein
MSLFSREGWMRKSSRPQRHVPPHTEGRGSAIGCVPLIHQAQPISLPIDKQLKPLNRLQDLSLR